MLMKIMPLMFNYKAAANSKHGSVNSASNPISQTTLSSFAYAPLNFKGVEAIAFANDLKGLDEIHCPICGVKMLSKDEMKELRNETSNIETTDDFINFTESRKENIHALYRNFIDSAKEIKKENPDITLDELFDSMQKKAASNCARATQKAVDNLEKVKKNHNLCESDEMLVDESIIRLEGLDFAEKPKESTFEMNQILSETLFQLEDTDKWKVHGETKNILKIPSMYLQIFLTDKDSTTKGGRKKQILSSLFGFSSSDVRRILNTKAPEEDKNYNLVLTCKQCDCSKSFLTRNSYPIEQREKNFTTYLDDVGKRILNGKLEGNSKYPMELAGFARAATKKEISIFPKTDVLKLLGAKVFDESKVYNEFDPVNHEGVPCSGCGKLTITHKQKCDIFDEIMQTETLQDLADIMENNSHYIRRKHEPLVHKFKELLNEEPNISDNKMLTEMRKFCANDFNKKILRISEKLPIMTEQYELNDHDKALVDEYLSRLNNEFYNTGYAKPFPYHKYTDMYNDTLVQLKTEKKDEFAIVGKELIRRSYSIQMHLYPDSPVVKKVGSTLKVFTQNLFKSAVATRDHFQPLYEGKEENDTPANCSVMCKDCNHEKGNHSPNYWHKMHPEFKKNLSKYLNKIIEMIKDGTLKDMESYPPMFSANVKYQTNSGITLYYEPFDK